VAGLGKMLKETTNIWAKEIFVLLRNEAAQSMALQKKVLFFKTQNAN